MTEIISNNYHLIFLSSFSATTVNLIFLFSQLHFVFPGPKELGEYLLKLDKDDELYNEYFQVEQIS